MEFSEAIAPWSVVTACSVVGGYLSGHLVAALHIGAVLGLIASVLYINWRTWGHPLRFSPTAL